MTTEDPDALLAEAYALDGPASNRSLYARWAATYESGFVAGRGYVYPERVVAVFVEHALAGADVGADDVVVDVGCGTGLAGVALRRRSPVAIDGIDLSPEMLQQASTKQHDGVGVYRRLLEVDLTTTLPIETGAYAGAVSVGTFTHGHVGPASLAEVIRIVRPGGRLAIGINAAHFAVAGFGPAFDELMASGRITGLRSVDVPIYDGADTIDRSDPDRYAHVAVFEVC
ncbi:MAG: methyltransferase domain-containing protein [Actinobacteria bacterium]|uniref:Unannotated protein n=1 Tax=freshwater metagenome TaxID=449393 RepID=A0A6J6G6A0_9ZZZZ|nr:methyltransferase domain-containing protein [Actinomycetota bacterium]